MLNSEVEGAIALFLALANLTRKLMSNYLHL